jgi:hypothetical protein
MTSTTLTTLTTSTTLTSNIQFQMTRPRISTATVAVILLGKLLPKLAAHCMTDQQVRKLGMDSLFRELALISHQMFDVFEYAEHTWNIQFLNKKLCKYFDIQAKVAKKTLQNGYNRATFRGSHNVLDSGSESQILNRIKSNIEKRNSIT